MRNRIRISYALVAVVAVLGLTGPAGAQDAETLIKDLQARLDGLDSFTADMKMKMNMMGMSMEYDGDLAFLENMLVMNMTMNVMGQSMNSRAVMDESGTMWTEVDVAGQKQVMKMDMNAMEEMGSELSGLPSTPGGMNNANPIEAIRQMLDTFNVTLEGKDTIEGEEVYRFSAEVKDELKDQLDPSGQLAQMGISPGELRLAFGVEDGFPRQYTTLGTDGSVFMEMTYTNVNLKPELDPAMFEYTPPEGVQVMDMMEMMQNAPQMTGAADAKFEIGTPAPAFTGTSLTGEEVSLADYEGKVVLIDFWATWCSPCIQELPHVIDAYKEYKDKGFDIIAISLDEEREDLESFLKDRPDMAWVQLFDNKGWEADIALAYEVEAIPFTLLVDQEGNVVAQDLRGDALANALAELLGE